MSTGCVDAAWTGKAESRRVSTAIAARGRIKAYGSSSCLGNADQSAQKLARRRTRKHHKSVGFAGGQRDLSMLDRIQTGGAGRPIGAFDRAEQVRPLGPWRGAGAI